MSTAQADLTQAAIMERARMEADLAFEEQLRAAEQAGCDFLEARLAEKNPLAVPATRREVAR